MSIREKMSVIDGPGAHMIELAMNHRTPEDYHDRPMTNDVEGMLSGLLVRVETSAEMEQELEAQAVMLVRRVHNKHGCTQFGPPEAGFEPCTHQRHYQDIAMMKTALRALFLNPPDVRYLEKKPKGWK